MSPIDEAGANESVGQRATRGAFWAGVEQWGGQLVGLLSFLVLARLLTPAAFGLLTMAALVVALLQAIVQQAFADAVVQRTDPSPELLDTAFWSTVGLGLAAAGIIAAASDSIASMFDAPNLGPVVAAMAATVPLAGLGSTHHAILRRKLDFRPLAMRGLASNLAGGVAGVALALAGAGVWSLVAQTLLTAAVGSLLLWRTVLWRPKLRFDGGAFGRLASFAGSLSAANAVNFVNRYADDLIIGLFLGPVALGFYTVAYRLLWSTTQVLTGIASMVGLPVFSRLTGDPARLRDVFCLALRMIAVLAFPVFAGIAIVAPELILVVFGARWLPSAGALRVLCAIGLLHSVSSLNPSAMVAAGRPDWVLRITGLNAVLNVIAFLVGVRWGIMGVAVAYVVRGYLTSFLPIVLLRSLIGLPARRFLRQIYGAAAATLPMAGAMFGVALSIDATAPVRLAAAAVVGSASYLLALSVTDRAGIVRLGGLARRLLASAGVE